MNLDNWKTVCTIVSGITQLIVLILPFIGEISNSKEVFWKRFTGLGKTMCMFAIVSVLATIASYLLDDKISTSKEEQFQSDLSKRDSIHALNVAKINSNVVDGFARYGLKYDSAQNKLTKLLEVPPTVRYYGAKPDFSVCDIFYDSLKDSILHIRVAFCVKAAACYDLNLTLTHIVYFENEKYHSFSNESLSLFRNQLFNMDITLTHRIHFRQLMNSPSSIIFHFVGTYKEDPSSKQLIKVDRFYTFNIKTKQLGQLSVQWENEILEAISVK